MLNASGSFNVWWNMLKVIDICLFHKFIMNYLDIWMLRNSTWTSWGWTHRLFKKIKNAIFLEILKNPFKRLLQWVQNLTNFFHFEISQQIWLLEAFKVSFGSNLNMNQDICLKFSAFVHHKSVQIWQKNFGRSSISLPAMAHFGQNFRCL